LVTTELNTISLPSNIDPFELPDAFSSFFLTKINNLRANLDSTESHPTPPDPQFTGKPLDSFSAVSQTQVSLVIKEMTPKSCELDPIPVSIFSEILPYLLPFITDLINSSLLSGIFPNPFKTAIIRPLLKKHNLDPNILKNFRPVSNLPFLSKVLEKVALKQLNDHLSANSLHHPFQSAYRANHSTETALVHIVNSLLLASDSGQVSLLTLLDLSAAFDTIDHSILLYRLSNTYGIRNTALSWFESYLTNRFQSVSINDIQSDPVQLTYGVPQGSVLGPVLFTLYTSPLSNIINQHHIKHHLYADDTQLLNSCKPQNIPALISQTSACFDDINSWMITNKLQLNADKTDAMLVGSNHNLSSLNINSIQLGKSDISLKDSVKNLGVPLDNTLSMKKYVSQISQSCYFQLRRISSIRKYLSDEATIKLVTSLILSRLDFCNTLLSGVPASTIQPLQRIQNSSARLILRKKKSDHVTPLLRSLHWLPVSHRIKYKVCNLCYKSLNNCAPLYLCECLKVYTPTRTLRSSSDTSILQIPRSRLASVSSRAFSVNGPHLWNSLPQSLRQSPSNSSFKSALKSYFFPSILD